MTELDDTTTDQPTETDTDSAAPDGTDEDTGPDDATRKARTDAAGYRRRLRDAEADRDSIAAERDALLEKITARQRADVEALAARELTDGSDLWQAVELAEVLDGSGDIDSKKVTAAVAELLEKKPHYRAPRQDFGLGLRGSPVKSSSGWEDVLRGRSRR